MSLDTARIDSDQINTLLDYYARRDELEREFRELESFSETRFYVIKSHYRYAGHWHLPAKLIESDDRSPDLPEMGNYGCTPPILYKPPDVFRGRVVFGLRWESCEEYNAPASVKKVELPLEWFKLPDAQVVRVVQDFTERHMPEVNRLKHERQEQLRTLEKDRKEKAAAKRAEQLEINERADLARLLAKYGQGTS